MEADLPNNPSVAPLENLPLGRSWLLATLVLGFLVVTLVGVWWVRGEWRAWQTALAENAAALERSTRAADYQLLADRYAEEIKLTRTYFVTDDDLPAFIELLEGFAGVTGATLDLSEVSPGPNKKVPTLVVRADATGSYAQLIQLLHLFETMPRVIKWNSVELAFDSLNAGSAGNTWRGGVSFELTSYEAP